MSDIKSKSTSFHLRAATNTTPSCQDFSVFLGTVIKNPSATKITKIEAIAGLEAMYPEYYLLN